MSFDFLLIFFVARYLRTALKTSQQNSVWDDRLKLAMYGALALFIASVIFRGVETIMAWVGHLCLLGCIYILYKETFFKPAKSIMVAILPYAVVAAIIQFLKLVLPAFYRGNHSMIDSLKVFAVLWGIGVWMVTNKQKKELDKTKEKVVEQEHDNRIITAMKTELEVQVAERTAELTRQKEELEIALQELKSTQAQLIQSEKMASLGELTAGIAHEIQNPLNFVNNFSEVSNELIGEMNEELSKGDIAEAMMIADDIRQNLEKINHHGKRADAIVKGMLQHSRSSNSIKEPTDINKLADEYFRLAYHGLRAKDKSFNATLKTDYDETIGNITIIPQDIGRVVLNLITNAFYVVDEKKKSGIEGYEPTVSVSTKKQIDKVLISVEDNGNGIPKTIVDKIFQPFFTTKPSGQGTGLGLSMSYDIVTQGHGGILKVETAEGKGTTFIISLPI